MGIKEKLESHILMVVVGVAVAVGGCVFAVTQYFHGEHLREVKAKYDLQHSTMQSRLASIERDLPDQKFYDVQKLRHRRDTPPEISKDAHYISEDKFYALLGGDYWDYEKTTGLKLLETVMDENMAQLFKQLGALGPLGKLLGSPVHMWKAKKGSKDDYHYSIKYSVDMPLGSTSVSMSVFPHIAVQRWDRVIEDAVQTGASLAQLEAGQDPGLAQGDPEREKDTREIFDRLRRRFYDDMAGTFFLLQAVGDLQRTLMLPNQVFRLRKIQMLENVLYRRSVTELRDVTVNGEAGKTLYLWQETILISTSARDRSYLISLTIPSLGPNPPKVPYGHANIWLANFRVVDIR